MNGGNVKILTYGEIMEGGTSLFTAIAQVNEEQLQVKFSGSIRVENPYKHLSPYIQDLESKLKEDRISSTVLDFTELKYCNSNGFYVLMDIIDMIYKSVPGDVRVNRLSRDDWHQETLPVLLNLEDRSIGSRTTLEDQAEI
jgi:hypothetical protein